MRVVVEGVKQGKTAKNVTSVGYMTSWAGEEMMSHPMGYIIEFTGETRHTV